MRTRTLLPITALIICYAATVYFNMFFYGTFVAGKQEAGLIQKMFGGLRVFVGDWAFMKAEEYHHRGLSFEEAMAIHAGESFTAEEHDHEHGHAAPVKRDLFSRIYGSVKVTADAHLRPAEEKEVLPWFYVETAFNPHDIRGYVFGGYWLARIGKFAESIRFLKEGERNNPDSARIAGNIGMTYYKHKDTEKAFVYLEKARQLWVAGKGENAVTNKYVESDLDFTFDLLGNIYESKGNAAEALKVYKEAYALKPSGAIHAKIERLEKGER
jgi:tetratricopeptide (TPR) repeat protein